MSSRNLSEPITDGGIQNVNFFNGRLLTADDLSAVLDAGRRHDRQLAEGLGEGVVHGLEVELSKSSTAARPVVRVTGGLAFNRAGAPVALAAPTVDVALARAQAVFAPEAGLFAECAGPGEPDNLGKLGVYVFVASPASTYEGSAPRRHSVTDDRFDGCGKRYAVEGVKFRLERIDFASLPGVGDQTRALLGSLTNASDAASVSKLRNVVAHLCFDSEEKTGQRRDPFKRPAGDARFVNYGALHELRLRKQLTDCDVPLAVVYWTPQGVRFVDNWAARRLARRPLDLDAQSLLRSHGYERFLQFQRHVHELFDALGALTAVRLQDYFAFVPPVGYFPVTGAKSPRGFHPANFFKQFTTGSPSDVAADGFGSVLRDSFACPDVALSSKPVFTVVRLRENVAAVAASSPSSQLHHAFVSRTLDGPLVHDGVAATLYDAWAAYRSVIRRRLFIMPYSYDYLGVNFGVVAAVNDVLFMANRGYALAAGRRLDTNEALKFFFDLHQMQNDLAKHLAKGIPYGDPTGDREEFAEGLDLLLNKAGASASKALITLIAAGNLPGVVEAQNAINAYVLGWNGDAVAVGPFRAAWQAAGSSGRNLVPGEGPYTHNFLVSNETDQALTFDLEPSISAAPGQGLTGDWEGAATVEDLNGQPVESVKIASGSKKTVVVKVSPPASGVTFEQTARLTLRASVAPPTDRSAEGFVDLKVARAEAQPSPNVVVFTGKDILPTNNPAAAAHASSYTWKFGVLYSGAAKQATFRVVVSLTGDMGEGWAVAIDEATPNATTGAAGQPGVFYREVVLSDDLEQTVTVVVLTPLTTSPQQRTATFNVGVESVDEAVVPSIQATHEDSFTVSVLANA
ncbi:MAG TPA: hypothetical protein VF668_01980 [Pyrinomonadaceae bacterium]|jgi:hypothetical protein